MNESELRIETPDVVSMERKVRRTRAVLAFLSAGVNVALGLVLLAVGGTRGGLLCVAFAPLYAAAGVAILRGYPIALAIAFAMAIVEPLLLTFLYGYPAGFMHYTYATVTVVFLVYDSRAMRTAIIVAAVTSTWAIQLAAPTPLDPFSPAVAEFLRRLNSLGIMVPVLGLVWYLSRATRIAERRLMEERLRTERLLRRTLPGTIVDRLKEQSGSLVDSADNVAVLFADIVGFTRLAGEISAAELVALLNRLFTAFDHLARRHGVEKIKTIGDAYMAVAGLPDPVDDPAGAMAAMALELRDVVAMISAEIGRPFDVRIGIAIGPVVAGVIGVDRFAYDLWGAVVNRASRLESHGVPGEVQIDAAMRDALDGRYELQPRGEIEVKGIGALETWLVGRRR